MMPESRQNVQQDQRAAGISKPSVAEDPEILGLLGNLKRQMRQDEKVERHRRDF